MFHEFVFYSKPTWYIGIVMHPLHIYLAGLVFLFALYQGSHVIRVDSKCFEGLYLCLILIQFRFVLELGFTHCITIPRGLLFCF